jgi:hypothetical protein
VLTRSELTRAAELDDEHERSQKSDLRPPFRLALRRWRLRVRDAGSGSPVRGLCPVAVGWAGCGLVGCRSSGEPPADSAHGLHHLLGAGLLEFVA